MGSGVGAVMAEIMEAMCLGPGGYRLSFVYTKMINELSCLRFGKQAGTTRSSNADVGGNRGFKDSFIGITSDPPLGFGRWP